ncbi:helix-turn-helix domain-containing protein [Chryseolinea lacunae]|uniref:Helix-turn-helix transcriptional regulator n=1 Tax=Chryseolinea lacunae TaxID=2801331 RepID=A0ABS1L2N5_9BACT|nr:helix-turn-helix transcriptional regulator [Chryseolinea lacunae]MBL0745935.1 helix-turn-helix transcriptional regulator [Chryseolinea lacunae]
MKKHAGLEEFRKSTPTHIKRLVDFSSDVAKRIDEILLKQGKTRRQLANDLGKKESQISKWMTGTHNFTFRTIAKIEAVLGEKLIDLPAPQIFLFQIAHGETNFTLSTKGHVKEEVLKESKVLIQSEYESFDFDTMCHQFN